MKELVLCYAFQLSVNFFIKEMAVNNDQEKLLQELKAISDLGLSSDLIEEKGKTTMQSGVEISLFGCQVFDQLQVLFVFTEDLEVEHILILLR